MDINQLKELLQNKGFTVTAEKEIPHGIKLTIADGTIVNVYKTGRISVQGKNPEPLKQLLGLPDKTGGVLQVTPMKEPKKDVFVVYGHDDDAKTQLEAMLRKWGLNPLILDQLPSGGKTIIEKLEKYTSKVDFCIVLATPDDIGYKKDNEEAKTFRARQNVVLELGMMLAKLGRDKVAILLKHQADMERPSDIQGLIYIPFKEDVKESRLQLAQEMTDKGYDIEVKDL